MTFTKRCSGIIAILDLKQTLDEKTSVLQKERAIFEEMRKTLDKVHFTKHIKLNVGGQVFKTSIETLVKDPGLFFLRPCFLRDLMLNWTKRMGHISSTEMEHTLGIHACWS